MAQIILSFKYLLLLALQPKTTTSNQDSHLHLCSDQQISVSSTLKGN